MGCSKAVQRGKFIEINVYIKKQERSQISNLIYESKNQKQNKLNLKLAEENNKDQKGNREIKTEKKSTKLR